MCFKERMDMTQANDTYPWWLKAIATLLSPFRAPGYSIKRDHTTKFDVLPSMAYQDLRNRIHNGDLLFCGGQFAFSKTIRYLSGCSKVSHVGIVYWWNDRLMLLESVETDGVRIVPVSQYVGNYENTEKPYNGRLYLARDQRLFRPPENEVELARSIRNPKVEQVLGDAASLLNKKFSFKDVFIFFLQGNTGRFQHEENDQFLCSEFVARCYAGVGIDYSGDGRGFVAPEHIAMSEHIDVLVEIVG
jgi:hypothetical protein